MGFEHIDHVQRDTMLSSPPHGNTTFPPGTWVLDPNASVIEISTRILGFHPVYIGIKLREGVADVDSTGIIRRLAISLLSETAHSGNACRDGHLRGPGYLDTRTWPLIDFVGSAKGNVIDGLIGIKGHRAGLRVEATEASLREDGSASLAAHGSVDRRLIGLGIKSLWCIGYDVTFTLKGTAHRI